MQRLRETLAHGGVVILAVVFAFAYATVNVANAVANEVVSVLAQTTYDEEGGGGFLQFTVWGTDISYGVILQTGIVLALVAGALLAVWHIAKSSRKSCPECQSEVPRNASVCRYCTAELTVGVE